MFLSGAWVGVNLLPYAWRSVAQAPCIKPLNLNWPLAFAYGCFHKFGVLFVNVLVLTALLLGGLYSGP